jgi:predicted metal-binding membrane protein
VSGKKIATSPEIALKVRVNPERAGLTPTGIVLALGGVAWVWTYFRMAGMPGGASIELGGLGWFSVSWVAMMAAMMLPAAARTIRYSRRFSTADAVPFTVGYLGVWVVVGLAAYAGVRGVHALHLSWLHWSQGGQFIAAGAILGAGAYQLTGPKLACLERCRRGHERSRLRRFGPASAAWMGVEHGCACLGCCWALMVALFALGVMSIVWMAVISVLVTAERLFAARFASRAVAVALAVLGLMVALAPGQLPGFTSPSHMAAGMRLS